MTTQLIEETGYDIRYTTTSDEPFLKTWLLDQQMRKWYPPSSDLDVEGFVRNWIGFSRFKCSLTATYDNKPVGVATIFLMPYLKVAHLCMLYIAIDPEFQRKGIGGSLIKNIIHLIKTKFSRLESMHVELYQGCPLISLLIKMGFKKVARQANFVMVDDKFVEREIYEIDIR